MTRRQDRASRKKDRTSQKKGSPFDKGHFCDLCGVFYDHSDLRETEVAVYGNPVYRLVCRKCRKEYRWMREDS